MTDPLYDFHQWLNGLLCGLNGSSPDEDQWASLLSRLSDLPRSMDKPRVNTIGDGLLPNTIGDGLSRMGANEGPKPVEGHVNFKLGDKLTPEALSQMIDEQAPAVPRYPDVA